MGQTDTAATTSKPTPTLRQSFATAASGLPNGFRTQQGHKGVCADGQDRTPAWLKCQWASAGDFYSLSYVLLIAANFVAPPRIAERFLFHHWWLPFDSERRIEADPDPETDRRAISRRISEQTSARRTGAASASSTLSEVLLQWQSSPPQPSHLIIRISLIRTLLRPRTRNRTLRHRPRLASRLIPPVQGNSPCRGPDARAGEGGCLRR